MQIGIPKTITRLQEKELIELRGKLGMEDKRASWKECELCDNSDFRAGTVCRVPGEGGGEPAKALDPEAEKIVQAITDQIIARM